MPVVRLRMAANNGGWLALGLRANGESRGRNLCTAPPGDPAPAAAPGTRTYLTHRVHFWTTALGAFRWLTRTLTASQAFTDICDFSQIFAFVGCCSSLFRSFYCKKGLLLFWAYAIWGEKSIPYQCRYQKGLFFYKTYIKNDNYTSSQRLHNHFALGEYQ